jgi:hypothetical protein
VIELSLLETAKRHYYNTESWRPTEEAVESNQSWQRRIAYPSDVEEEETWVRSLIILHTTPSVVWMYISYPWTNTTAVAPEEIRDELKKASSTDEYDGVSYPSQSPLLPCSIVGNGFRGKNYWCIKQHWPNTIAADPVVLGHYIPAVVAGHPKQKLSKISLEEAVKASGRV